MRRIAIIQARMGSARLPGKVLADVAGRPMLAHQLTRLERCQRIDELVVATTTSPADDDIAMLAAGMGVRCVRGSEADVLGRYVEAARAAAADVVVRSTADCPLIDPEVVDAVVHSLVSHRDEVDYASNVVQRTFPHGLDVEAFFVDVLWRMNRLGSSAGAREHVTQFLLRERPDLFCVLHVAAATDDSDLRWTVDTPEDLAFVRHTFSALGLGDEWRDYRDIVAYCRTNGLGHHGAAARAKQSPDRLSSGMQREP